MELASNVVIVYGVVAIPVCVGLRFLQRWLSRMDRRWPGMILPVMAFVLAAIYTVMTEPWGAYFGGDSVQIFLRMAGIFVAANIPTLVFLVIYFLCRRGREERTRMNLKDL